MLGKPASDKCSGFYSSYCFMVVFIPLYNIVVTGFIAMSRGWGFVLFTHTTRKVRCPNIPGKLPFLSPMVNVFEASW